MISAHYLKLCIFFFEAKRLDPSVPEEEAAVGTLESTRARRRARTRLGEQVSAHAPSPNRTSARTIASWASRMRQTIPPFDPLVSTAKMTVRPVSVVT